MICLSILAIKRRLFAIRVRVLSTAISPSKVGLALTRSSANVGIAGCAWCYVMVYGNGACGAILLCLPTLNSPLNGSENFGVDQVRWYTHPFRLRHREWKNAIL